MMDKNNFLSNLNDNLTTKPIEKVKNEEFSKDVASGKIKFLTVVESIQGVLTNENVGIREKGIEFLSWLLAELPKDLFNFSEINVLTNFYSDCLKGHHSFLSSTIKGLLELVKMKHVTQEVIVKVLVCLFQHVNCQTQLQQDRILIYKFLKIVIEDYLEYAKPMGPDFVFGVISLIEGESDPVCLMLVFEFIPVFIKNFDLGHLSEELFESLSCYFPIDFSPTSNDNITITREDLARGLHQCLSATNSFSELCLPVIIEKSESTHKNAKLDSYSLLQDCCNTLKVVNLEKHINSLWKNVSKDVLPGSDKQVAEAGLLALTKIFSLLSKDESQLKILSTFMEDILLTVRSSSNRIDENMFQPSVKVLIAAATCSKPAALLVLRHLKTLPQPKTDSPMEKKIMLSSFQPFLTICHKFKLAENQDNEIQSCFLELIAVYLDAAVSSDYEIRKLAFSGLLEILPQSSAKFRTTLCDIVLDNIRSKSDIKTSDEFIKLWRSISQFDQSEFYSFLTQNFTVKETDNYFKNALWALSFVADLPEYTKFIISLLVGVIENGENYLTGLECLLNSCKVAKSNESSLYFVTLNAEHHIPQRLIKWCLDSQKNINNTLSCLCETVALVTRNLEPAAQQSSVDSVAQLFLQNQPQVNGDSVQINDVFTNLVLVTEAVLGSVRPQVTIPSIRTFRAKLTHLALNNVNDSVRCSSSRVLATFVNKSEESVLSELLSEISKEIFGLLDCDYDLKLKLNAAFLFTWIVKGVVLRGSQFSSEWISTWFSLLGRKDIGEVIAEGFKTVIEENELYLNLESHCNVRILYRQRLFGRIAELVKLYEMSEDSVKMNFLLALVRLLQGVPVHLVQMEINNIVTILCRCLDCDKPEVLQTTLEILTALLKTKEKIFADYISSFVPKFLKLSRFDGFMKIRINAMQCLFFYGFYPTAVLLPLKQEVIRELESCLDDKKRLARKEAVKARCRWFLVGAPGEEILEL